MHSRRTLILVALFCSPLFSEQTLKAQNDATEQAGATQVETSVAGWPQYRGPNGNGLIQSSVSLRPKHLSKRHWKAQVGTGFSSLALAHGSVVTMGHSDGKDSVTCLSLKDGSLRWKYSFESELDSNMYEGGQTSTPTIAENDVFALSKSGRLLRIDLANGRVKWKKELNGELKLPKPGWGFGGSPIVVGNTLLLNAGSAGLCLDKNSGQLIWKSDEGEAGYTTPRLYSHNEQLAAIFSSGKYITARLVKSGDELWKIRWLTQFGANAADPIVHDGAVFLSSGYNRGSGLFRLDSPKPKAVWKHKRFQNQISSSVLIDGYLFGFDGNTHGTGKLGCVDWKTGEIQWLTDESGLGQLIAIGKQLIIVYEDGRVELASANREQYQAVTVLKLDEDKYWTPPAYAQNRLLVRSASGAVYCLGN